MTEIFAISDIFSEQKWNGDCCAVDFYMWASGWIRFGHAGIGWTYSERCRASRNRVRACKNLRNLLYIPDNAGVLASGCLLIHVPLHIFALCMLDSYTTVYSSPWSLQGIQSSLKSAWFTSHRWFIREIHRMSSLCHVSKTWIIFLCQKQNCEWHISWALSYSLVFLEHSHSEFCFWQSDIFDKMC